MDSGLPPFYCTSSSLLSMWPPCSSCTASSQFGSPTPWWSPASACPGWWGVCPRTAASSRLHSPAQLMTSIAQLTEESFQLIGGPASWWGTCPSEERVCPADEKYALLMRWSIRLIRESAQPMREDLQSWQEGVPADESVCPPDDRNCPWVCLPSWWKGLSSRWEGLSSRWQDFPNDGRRCSVFFQTSPAALLSVSVKDVFYLYPRAGKVVGQMRNGHTALIGCQVDKFDHTWFLVSYIQMKPSDHEISAFSISPMKRNAFIHQTRILAPPARYSNYVVQLYNYLHVSVHLIKDIVRPSLFLINNLLLMLSFFLSLSLSLQKKWTGLLLASGSGAPSFRFSS